MFPRAAIKRRWLPHVRQKTTRNTAQKKGKQRRLTAGPMKSLETALKRNIKKKNALKRLTRSLKTTEAKKRAPNTGAEKHGHRKNADKHDTNKKKKRAQPTNEQRAPKPGHQKGKKKKRRVKRTLKKKKSAR